MTLIVVVSIIIKTKLITRKEKKMSEFKTMAQVVEETGIAGYTISNYYKTKKIAEPEKLSGTRMFSAKDIKTLVDFHTERGGKILGVNTENRDA